MGCKLGRKLGFESGSWSDQVLGGVLDIWSDEVLGGVLDIWREPGSACVLGFSWGMEWACESGVESDAASDQTVSFGAVGLKHGHGCKMRACIPVWACESGSWSDSGSDPLLAQAWGGE